MLHNVTEHKCGKFVITYKLPSHKSRSELKLKHKVENNNQSISPPHTTLTCYSKFVCFFSFSIK